MTRSAARARSNPPGVVRFFSPLMSSSPDADSLRLTDADFDAYLPERATSNAFTRPRLELKQRMLAWAKGVVTRLAEIGISVEVTASDEHPSLRNGRRVDCQRVFFWRDAEARAAIEQLIDSKRSLAATLGDPAPHQRHAFLALRVDAERVEVSVELHPEAWVDARNLRALLVDPARTLALTSALEALPDQFTIGLSSDAERTPAARATSDSIRDLGVRSEQEARSLWIGWTIPRDVAVTHAELLVDQLEDAIVALGPIEKVIAWATGQRSHRPRQRGRGGEGGPRCAFTRGGRARPRSVVAGAQGPRRARGEGARSRARATGGRGAGRHAGAGGKPSGARPSTARTAGRDAP